MNDESSVFENTETTPRAECDTLAKETATTTDAGITSQKEEALNGAVEDSAGVPADTGTDFDPDCEDPDSKAQESELEQLRGELKHLREELARRDVRMHREERISKEYDEFCDLYPDVPISSLTGEIWQDVAKGTSLAAAYALAEKRKSVSLKKAAESNTSNRARSAGAVNNAENIEFSPAEVRAMSSAEVRANLPKIMRSMQKWH